MPTESCTRAGLHSLRALLPRAGTAITWRCFVVGVAVLAIGVGSARSAEQDRKQSSRWSWFPLKQAAHLETVNPFEGRPAPDAVPATTYPYPSTTAAASPGIAQPSFLLPSAPSASVPAATSSDSTTPMSTPGLSQPKWMLPQDMVVVTDDPMNEPPPAELKPQSPMSTTGGAARSAKATGKSAAPPSMWAGLWQGVSGTNASAYVEAPENRKSELDGPGGDLVRQVAGVGTPTAPTDYSAPASTASLSESLFPIWAEPQTDAASRPENTTTPSARSQPMITADTVGNDPTASLWLQMGFVPDSAVEPASAARYSADGTSHVVPGPAAPQESIWSALWRPVAMTTNATPALAEQQGAVNDTNAANKTAKNIPESEMVPDLLKPFYFTESRPAAGTAGGAGRVANAPPVVKPLEHSLVLQLTLTGDEFLRAAEASSFDEPVASDPGTVAAAWVNELSTLSNPFLITQQGLPTPMAPNRMGLSSDTMQASFMQDALPRPNGSSSADEIDLPGDHDDDDASETRRLADGGDDKEGLVGAETLGTAPEDTTLDFLRSQTVLLKPGKMQFDIGFQYQLAENDFPILLVDSMGEIIGVSDVKFRGRELSVPLQARFGVLNRVQAFIQVPVGWSNTQVAIDGVDMFQNDGGLGDISFGTMVQLCDATPDRPYMIGSFTALAPTGGDPFTGIVGFSPSAPSLGNGFWALGGNLLWIETRYDPVIVFYGLGYRYQFSHRYIGIEFQPGPEYNYTFGYGFAVNERVTLSTQFFGAYVEEFKANGRRLEGTNQEPMNVQLAATFIDRCDRIVEPFVTFGLTDDAISANVGITWTY